MEQTVSQKQNQLPVVMPATDVFETDENVQILLEVPGVKMEDIDLQIENSTLTVQGETSLEVPEGLKRSFSEFRQRCFRRSFELHHSINSEKVSASLSHGVLKITLPKNVKPSRKIAISTGN